METIKKGFQGRKQSWLCKGCGQLFVNSQRVSRADVEAAYATGKYTTAQLTSSLGVSRRTVCRRLETLLSGEFQPTAPKGKVVAMMDASYWGSSLEVVVIKYYRTRK